MRLRTKICSSRVVAISSWSVLLTLMIGFVPIVLQAQHNHGQEANSVFERFQKPQVKYQLQAEVLAHEGLIRGWMDISWTNQSTDTISTVCLDLGFSRYADTVQFDFHTVQYTARAKRRLTGDRANYCWLDSVLYQAARLSETARMRGKSLVEIRLPVPILPGQAGPLMISFETRFKPVADSLTLDSLWRVIPEWFPQMAHYQNGEWLSTSDLEATDDHPMASYEISISIDSSYNLIGSGELMNDKVHFGTPPKPTGDKVEVDVTGFLYAFNPDNPYHPKFKDGLKKYYYRLLNGNNFPIVLAKDIRMDLAMAGDQSIEITYPPKVANFWQERVGTQARLVLEELSDKLGHYPYPIMRIIALPEGEANLGPREMIFLSERVGGNSDLRSALTNLISRSWLADFICQSCDTSLTAFHIYDEALASIIAEDVKTGFDRTGTIGVAEMVSSTVGNWKLSTPIWIDKIKSKYSDLVIVVGQEKFLEFISKLSNKYQFRPVSENEFIELLKSTCGDEAVELIRNKEQNQTSKALDLHRMKTKNR